MIDPLLGMAFGFVLLWASWGILRDAARLLMEATPSEIDLESVIADLETLDGVRDVHHVHAWTLTSGRNVFSAHLRVGDGADPQAVQRRAHRVLREDHDFFFVTLQTETECLDERGAEMIDITSDRQAGNG